MLGSGGIVVLDETVSIVEFALRTIAFYQHESCGWCIPCREGTDWIKKTLTRVYNGGGNKKDVDNVQYLAENMMGRTFCPLGDAAAMPTLGFVKKFRKEFEDYIEGHKAGTPIITVRAARRSRTLNKTLPRLVWVLVAIVLLVGLFRVLSLRKHYSADQQILIEKSK